VPGGRYILIVVAVALLAIDLDVAGGLLDESIDHAQAEAGALARALRRKERVEHLVEHPGGNAVSGVADGDQGIVRRAERRHACPA